MLEVNQLIGFGAQAAAGNTYRYLRLKVTAGQDPTYTLPTEIRWLVGATTYPTSNMTSNTAPSPLVASASNDQGGLYPAYKAFDGSTATVWQSNGGYPVWHQIDLGAGNGITPTGIRISPYDAVTYNITAFSCYGSNTGAFGGEETLLGSFSPGATGWNVVRDFTF